MSTNQQAKSLWCPCLHPPYTHIISYLQTRKMDTEQKKLTTTTEALYPRLQLQWIGIYEQKNGIVECEWVWPTTTTIISTNSTTITSTTSIPPLLPPRRKNIFYFTAKLKTYHYVEKEGNRQSVKPYDTRYQRLEQLSFYTTDTKKFTQQPRNQICQWLPMMKNLNIVSSICLFISK